MGGSKNPQRYYPVLGDTRVLGWCSECVQVMNKIGYPIKDVDWRIGRSASWFGLAYKKFNLIVLNQELVKEDEAAVKNTIFHELAHLAAPEYAKHGYEWKCVCEKIRQYTGQVITRTNPFSQHQAVKVHRDSKIKYIFQCPECGCLIKCLKTTRFVREYNLEGSDGEPKWWCSRCKRTTGNKIAFKRLK